MAGFGRGLYQNGYLDIGRIRIPPLPRWIALTDRADGTIWYLAHNVTVSSPDGAGYISITDVQPRPDRDWVIYGSEDGPILPGDDMHPDLRLLVRDGRIGYEIYSDGHAHDNSGQVLTRRGVASETREVYRPAGWKPTHILGVQTDELAWKVRSVS